MAIPVILDTDIGMDVDDVWALAFLLRCPELDVKLVTTCTGDTRYRACVAAKVLAAAGRSDVPIGIGIPLDRSPRTHAAWLDGYELAAYAGPVLEDGVGAICDTVLAAQDQVSIISIGPLPNIAAALARLPALNEQANFIGMHGSVRRGYLGAAKPMREYNVVQHSLSAQRVFNAPWRKTITPLDTCGNMILSGDQFATIVASDDPVARIVRDNHFLWFDAVRDWPVVKDMDPQSQSSILYDTVAVGLAFAEPLLAIEALPLSVTEDGKTMLDEANGSTVRCATEWRDEARFKQLLVTRLTQGTP